jgi:hypothetical protein
MRFKFFLFVAWALLAALPLPGQVKPPLQDGDLLFQSTSAGQSLAIRLATGSKYSHMGMVYVESGKIFVLEAVQPVKLTPLEDWIKRGDGGHFVAKRLKDAGKRLTPEITAELKKYGRRFLGRDYDAYFHWSDDRIYCSELVWKIYRGVLALEIGRPVPLRTFDLSHGVVRQKLRERYGDDIPLDEPVISPAAMFGSDLLITVFSN